MSRCRFVLDHQADYPVVRLCRLAGVARSTFYAWCSRPRSARAVSNEPLLAQITEAHQASRGTYGRVLGQLERRPHCLKASQCAQTGASSPTSDSLIA